MVAKCRMQISILAAIAFKHWTSHSIQLDQYGGPYTNASQVGKSEILCETNNFSWKFGWWWIWSLGCHDKSDPSLYYCPEETPKLRSRNINLLVNYPRICDSTFYPTGCHCRVGGAHCWVLNAQSHKSNRPEWPQTGRGVPRLLELHWFIIRSLKLHISYKILNIEEKNYAVLSRGWTLYLRGRTP